MNNADNSDAGSAPEASATQAGASAGTILRQAREAAGLHIAALAVSMKIPVKKLEALESDRLDLLPDAVFARALAGSMCRALKIDPNPVLDKLPGNKKVSLTLESRAANQPFSGASSSGDSASGLKLGKTAIFTVIALLLGIGLVLFVPDLEVSKSPADTSTEVVEPHFPVDSGKQIIEEIITPAETVLPADRALLQANSPALTASAAVTPVVSPVAAPTPAPVPLQAPAPAPAPAVSAPKALQPAPGNVGIVPSLPVPKQDPVSAPAAVSANHVVVFKVRGSSWVEVTDAKGLVQLRRTMAEGEVAGAAGTLPLVVVIGRVDMTDITVRGKPYDVSKVALGNVARFEVK